MGSLNVDTSNITYTGKLDISSFSPLMFSDCNDLIIKEHNKMDNGRSCHNCRKRKSYAFVTRCRKVHPGNKKCRKQFCNYCLRKKFNLILYKSKRGNYLLNNTEKLEELLTNAERTYCNLDITHYEKFKLHSKLLPNLLDLSVTAAELENSICIEKFCCPICIEVSSFNCTIPRSINDRHGSKLPYSILPTNSPSHNEKLRISLKSINSGNYKFGPNYEVRSPYLINKPIKRTSSNSPSNSFGDKNRALQSHSGEKSPNFFQLAAHRTSYPIISHPQEIESQLIVAPKNFPIIPRFTRAADYDQIKNYSFTYKF